MITEECHRTVCVYSQPLPYHNPVWVTPVFKMRKTGVRTAGICHIYSRESHGFS